MSSERTATDYTARKERTLRAASTPPEGEDTEAEPVTVMELSVPDPHRDQSDSGADSGAGGDADGSGGDDAPAADAVKTAPDGPSHRLSGAFRICAKVVAWTTAFPLLCVLPFLVVLRISVLAYQESVYDGWQALVIGILAALLLVCVYIAVFMWTFGIRRRFYMPLLNICLTAMLCYSGFALFHLAVSNAKTEEVRSYYTSLHPFLRVAVKNLTILDEDLVITDVQRTRAAYRAMGLPPRDYSLHFKQSTGFVHAVDIRTVGRSQTTNLLVELYFVLMGFETIRHVGTADHLHVALPLVDTE